MTEPDDLHAALAVHRALTATEASCPTTTKGVRCDRPTDNGTICRACTAEIAGALTDLATELRTGEYGHRASGLEGKGFRSGTTTRAGHGEGFATSLVLAVRMIGQRARYWTSVVHGQPADHDPTAALTTDTAHALTTLAQQRDRIRHHHDTDTVLELRDELLTDTSRLQRQLNPPVPDDERWVQHLKANANAGRDAWLPIADVLTRWAALRKVDRTIGPPPSRRTVERWAFGHNGRPALLHTQRPPGYPALVQVGAVLDLAHTHGRTQAG